MDTINDMNYEELLVRYAEGELSETERLAVEDWLSAHPEAQEELSLFLAAPRLEPLEADFEGKEELKRSVVVPLTPWKQWLTYAACAALLVGIGWQLWPVAKVEPEAPQPEYAARVETAPSPQPVVQTGLAPSRTPRVETRPASSPILECTVEEETGQAPSLQEEVFTPDPLPLVPQVDRATFDALLAENFPAPEEPLNSQFSILNSPDTLVILSPRQEPSLLAARSEELVDDYRFWTSILDQSRAALRDAVNSFTLKRKA